MVEATPLVGGTTMTDATEGLTAAAGPGFRFGGASVCCPRPSTVAPDAHPAELSALAAASNSAKTVRAAGSSSACWRTAIPA